MGLWEEQKVYINLTCYFFTTTLGSLIRNQDLTYFFFTFFSLEF